MLKQSSQGMTAMKKGFNVSELQKVNNNRKLKQSKKMKQGMTAKAKMPQGLKPAMSKSMSALKRMS